MDSNRFHNNDLGGEADEELLDFNEAMRDFQQMFPNICAAQIECALRKYEGDVSATINELLYDRGGEMSISTLTPTFYGRCEDILTQLRRRRHEVNEKLKSNQVLLDRVTDVELARTYEDQQLALLLEHREVSMLISEQKLKQAPKDSCIVPGCRVGRGQVKVPPNKYPVTSENTILRADKLKNPDKTQIRRRFDVVRVPDGPLLQEKSQDSFSSKIKETLKKASGSRISRLFSAP